MFGQPKADSAQGTQDAGKPVSSAPSMIWPCYNKVTWWTSKLAASIALWKQVAAWSCHFLSTSSLAAALCARPGALASGQHRFVSFYSKGQMQFPPAKKYLPQRKEKEKKKKVLNACLSKEMGSCVLKVKFQLLQLGFVAILQYQQADTQQGESEGWCT